MFQIFTPDTINIQNIGVAKLVKKLKNVKTRTIMTPGPAIPEITKRKPRKRK